MNKTPVTRSWPLIVVAALLVVSSALFLVAFIQSSGEQPMELNDAAPDETVITALLTGADPSRGAVLLETYGCNACHQSAATNQLAPALEGVASRAAERHPPLSVEQYLYQSIVRPSAWVVEGYANVMPQNFGTRINERDLGDLLAYLLTLEA